MGMDDREVRSCIRFSVGRFTTKDEILEALAATGDALAAQAAGAKLST
jgi:cysteine sulfinate desulfinase/cysteine desulfurase-like protein